MGPNEAAHYVRKHRNFTLPVMFFYSNFQGMDFKHSDSCLYVYPILFLDLHFYILMQ